MSYLSNLLSFTASNDSYKVHKKQNILEKLNQKLKINHHILETG